MAEGANDCGEVCCLDCALAQANLADASLSFIKRAVPHSRFIVFCHGQRRVVSQRELACGK
jgi:hypothetical protein